MFFFYRIIVTRPTSDNNNGDSNNTPEETEQKSEHGCGCQNCFDQLFNQKNNNNPCNWELECPQDEQQDEQQVDQRQMVEQVRTMLKKRFGLNKNMSVKEHDEFEQAVQSIIKQFHHQNLNDQRKHLNRPSVQQLGEWLSKGDKTDVINTIVHCQNAPALASIFFCLNDLDINDTVAVMCKTDSKFKVNFTELLLVNNNLDVRQISSAN